MSVTLIDEKQIKDYRVWTGTWQATGMSISGDVAVTGLLSGTASYSRAATVENLTVTNAVISPYLSGVIGTTVTGSGIVHIMSVPDTSGNNIHFRHVIHTGDPAYPVQAFSSYDNQDDWYYWNNGTWSDFPTLGLPSAVQNDSIVRHIWSPTGMDVVTKYYSHVQTIFAGNVSGGYNNSCQFQSPTNGFTVNHIPFWQSYYDTADSRYVRRIILGPDAVPSGLTISGCDIVVPVSGTVPAHNHGNGTLLAVGNILYLYGTNGYQPVSLFSGLSVPSGGAITGANPIFSGMGQVSTTINGNIIGISGGGVDTFAIPTGVARKGNLILSGAGFLDVTEVLTESGTMIVLSGIGDGTGAVNTTGPGNITGIGVGLDAGTALATGGFVFTGEGRVSTYTKDYGNNISGIVISGASGVLQTIALATSTPRYGDVILSGEGGTQIREILTSSGVLFAISGAGAGAGGGGVGNVTGLGVDLDGLLYTGGFVVTGVGTITTRLTNLGANISGILISGGQNISYSGDYIVENYYTTSGGVSDVGIQAGSALLPVGVSSTGISLNYTLSGVPTVRLSVAVPSTGTLVYACVDVESVTQSGFTALFSSAIPESGYRLYWEAANTGIAVLAGGEIDNRLVYTNETGSFASLYVSGANVPGNVTITGVGGTQVIQSGQAILVSGGAGGGSVDILQVQIFSF